MKHPVLPAFLMLWLIAGCGKVGDPRPPSIRIPAKIGDLRASQNQYDVTLTWTNPAKYADGSNATDLANVRILQNGAPLATVPISGAGKTQTSAPFPEKSAVGSTVVYTIEVETRRGKLSADSNLVSIAIVDVPGPILNATGEMDQGHIHLEWSPPDQRASLADVYIIRREDGGLGPLTVHETHYDDVTVESLKTYRYTITAAHGTTDPVPGPPSATGVILAKDGKPPSTPKGLQPPLVSDSGAILSWEMNTETDLAGYLVFRSDSPDPKTFTSLDNSAIHTSSSVRDENYKPGTYYAVEAVDDSGNKSEMSAPVRAP